MTLWDHVYDWATSLGFLAALWFTERFFGIHASICVAVGVSACVIIWEIGKGEQ